MKLITKLFVFIYLLNTIKAKVYDFQPQQIHLALGGKQYLMSLFLCAH